MESPSTPLLSRSLDMTLREWIDHFQHHVVMKQVFYRGIPCWKNPFDLWVIQEIIQETKPEVVVEIGCKFGGTTLWLADLLKTIGNGMVIGVDIERPPLDLPENAQFVLGDSVAAETVDKVRRLCGGRRAMIMSDGNHAAAHVLQELRSYSPLVAPGCYFIAEDGIVDVMEWAWHQPGPLPATQQFLAENREFSADLAREKFVLTYSPGGFLRRAES